MFSKNMPSTNFLKTKGKGEALQAQGSDKGWYWTKAVGL